MGGPVPLHGDTLENVSLAAKLTGAGHGGTLEVSAELQPRAWSGPAMLGGREISRSPKAAFLRLPAADRSPQLCPPGR